MPPALAALVLFATTHVSTVARPPTLAPLIPRMTAPVVNIHTTRRLVASSLPLVNQLLPRRSVHALGSGVIIDPGGMVLTNEHIVHGATEVRVSIGDGRDLPAYVVGVDADLDIALLRIDAKHPLPAARLGHSSRLRVGDYVVAVGNPFGLDHTVTAGIISARGRQVGGGAPLLQTDASINPGNSGGPLYSLDGAIVGLNTAIVAGAHGIGFALPIDVVRRAMPMLEREGRIRRGFVGVQVARVPEDLARAMGVRAGGAFITDVQANGPFAHAGILPGDVIVRWDGEPVDSEGAVPWLVALTPPGSRVHVTIVREGDPISREVHVAPLKPGDTGP